MPQLEHAAFSTVHAFLRIPFRKIVSRNYHFVFPAKVNVLPFAPTRFVFCIRFHPKDPGVPGWSASRTQKSSFARLGQLFGHLTLNSPRRPDWFSLPVTPTRLAVAEPPCAAACFPTGAASDGSSAPE